MYYDLRDVDADLITVSAHKISPRILHFEINAKQSNHLAAILEDDSRRVKPMAIDPEAEPLELRPCSLEGRGSHL
jgi:hypothetical protein